MLRKFHASHLYNDGLSRDEIDELQGGGKDQTRTSYFMKNHLRLMKKYIEHMGAITINLDVEILSIKSPEFIRIEKENEQYKNKFDNLQMDVDFIQNNSQLKSINLNQ